MSLARRPPLALSAGLLLALATAGLLRPGPSLAAAPPASSAAAAPAASAALARLADALAVEVRAAQPEPPVALHVTAPAAPLARALATLLAARLAQAGLAPLVLEAPSPAAAEPLARERGARALLRVGVALESGELRARGDLLGTWVNFWSGRTPTRPPAPAAALAHTVAADAPALALAAEPPAAQAPAGGPRRLLGAPFAQLSGHSAALAAGDLDGDGRDEVAALLRLPSGEEQVVVLDAAGRLIARHALQALAPSATPTREPFGALAFQSSPRRLLARSAAREAGEALVLRAHTEVDAALAVQARLEGPVALGAGLRAALVEGQALLGPELQWGAGAPLRAQGPFVTASAARPAAVDRPSPLLLLVYPDGRGSLHAGAQPAVALGPLGAGSALVDVGGDGRFELLTTQPQVTPSPERLRLYALPPPSGGALGPVLWEAPLPRGRALQVAAARLEPGADQQVLVACWLEDGTTELTLFRQVAP